MPSDDNGTELSEMRASVDPVLGEDAEYLSEVQDTAVEYPSETEIKGEIHPESANYRVTVADYGCVQNDVLAVDYFARYEDAVAMYEAHIEDEEFIRHHDKYDVWVILEKSYRGMSQIFWETIRKSVVYDGDYIPRNKSR